ncbi:MAG: MarR family transcriptional regulator [Chloroflexota bacterium]|nr:MarR family transcriptional regulator [Chloroflexota bacterium]
MGNWTSEDATREVLAVLPLLNRIVGAEVRREAGEDTTIGQFRVLAHLAEGSLTLSVLAKRRRVSLQSMSELMQVLVERGWISRAPDPSDRRQHLLELTEPGRAHYLRVQEMTIRQLAPLLAQLSADEMAAVRMALPALRRVLMQEENSERHGD